MTEPWRPPPTLPLYGAPPPFPGPYAPYGPYPRYPPVPPPPPAGPRNGFGVTALTCGIIGVLFGLLPVTFALAGLLGVIALVFGVLGGLRARRREATNGPLAVIGAVLGAGALVLSVVGLVILLSHVRHGIDRVGHYFTCVQNVAPDDPQRQAKIDECGNQFN
jgi:hypothetical protein